MTRKLLLALMILGMLLVGVERYTVDSAQVCDGGTPVPPPDL